MFKAVSGKKIRKKSKGKKYQEKKQPVKSTRTKKYPKKKYPNKKVSDFLYIMKKQKEIKTIFGNQYYKLKLVI
jgi:hypothetical protein